MCACVYVCIAYDMHKHVCEHAHMYSHRDQRKMSRILLHNSSFSSASGVGYSVYATSLQTYKQTSASHFHSHLWVQSHSSVFFNPCWALHPRLVVINPHWSWHYHFHVTGVAGMHTTTPRLLVLPLRVWLQEPPISQPSPTPQVIPCLNLISNDDDEEEDAAVLHN